MSVPVDRVFNSQVDKDNNLQNRINFNKMIGDRLSAMEHLIPEHKMDGFILHSEATLRVNHMDVMNEMFSTDEAPAEGISAVKALALASAQGQKIWTITQDNLELALIEMSFPSDTETEIRNSVNAGMVVTAHEQQINFNGWIGEGYIILDPATGAGAYKIAGGGNGGVLKKLNKLLIKGMFYIGAILGLQENNYVARAILKGLGVLVATIFDLVNIWSKCSGSIAVYLSLFAILSSVAIAFALFFATGGVAIALIGFVIPMIQNQVVNRFTKEFC